MSFVSVIIPTYNRSQLLKQAITSVLSQTYADFEIWVVNDGSTDDTGEVVGAIGDPRVHYIYQENSGLAAARNVGIRQAQGTYVAFLDDDDLWLPEKLGRQVGLFEQQPDLGLVTCGYRTIDGQGVKLSEVRPWAWRPELNLQTWLYGCPTVPSAVMVRREWLEKIGGFNEQISRQGLGSEDWELWLRLASLGCQMEWIKECLCAYRVHSGSMAHRASKQREGMILTLNAFFKLPHLSAEVRAEKDLAYSHAYLRGAAREYAAGLVDEAATDVRHAVDLNPTLLEKKGDRLLKFLLDWIHDPIIEDQEGYISRIFDNLPENATVIRSRKKYAVGMVARVEYFEAYKANNVKVMNRSLKKLLHVQPVMLLDRGIFSGIYYLLKQSLTGRVKKSGEK